MPASPVVANNTPLVGLWVLGRLDLLRELFDVVFVPDAVRAEFVATEQERRAAALDACSWIVAVPLAHPQRTLAYSGLDAGEAAVLALAEERQAALVLMDERRGRRYCQRLGIPVAGTLAVLLLARERGLIPSVAPLLRALVDAGLHISPALVAQALITAGEAAPSAGPPGT
jgi:hypothetical protein